MRAERGYREAESQPALPRTASRQGWLARVRGLFAGQGSGAECYAEARQMLDAVGGLGQTPVAYGWRIDEQLRLRPQFAGEPLRALGDPAVSVESKTGRRVPFFSCWTTLAPRALPLSAGGLR